MLGLIRPVMAPSDLFHGGAKAFAGISPQAVITVTEGKKSEYKKFLHERGVTKNMTVK